MECTWTEQEYQVQSNIHAIMFYVFTSREKTLLKRTALSHRNSSSQAFFCRVCYILFVPDCLFVHPTPIDFQF